MHCFHSRSLLQTIVTRFHYNLLGNGAQYVSEQSYLRISKQVWIHQLELVIGCGLLPGVLTPQHFWPVLWMGWTCPCLHVSRKFPIRCSQEEAVRMKACWLLKEYGQGIENICYNVPVHAFLKVCVCVLISILGKILKLFL